MALDANEVAALRADTPGISTGIHFDNAGASLMPAPVFDAVATHLALERDVGGYRAAEIARETCDDFYPAMAQLINAKPQEIAYLGSATQAWQSAFFALQLKPGDRILTHKAEYVSNVFSMLYMAENAGVEIDFAPSDAHGQIDVGALPSLITARTKLIALTHMPSQGGLINPAAEVGAIARAHGLLYLLDACQSVGHIQIDVEKIGCHMLSGTGRKYLRGPRGTGFLYVSEDVLNDLAPPFIDLQSAQWTADDHYDLTEGTKRFETFERNVAGQIGLGVAARYALSVGMELLEARILHLSNVLRDALESTANITIYDQGVRKSGIVTFASATSTSQDIKDKLSAENIRTSLIPAANARRDLAARGAPDLVRASLHAFNTEAEIARFVAAL